MLSTLLERNEILVHPFVVGEIALGNLRQRAEILSSLQKLPQAVVARDSEVLTLIDSSSLFGLGIGYVDIHLLASVKLTEGLGLWTRDKRLNAAAAKLGLAAAMLN